MYSPTGMWPLMSAPPITKVLGIRTAPQQVRYALIAKEGETCTLLNRSTENSLRRPAELEENIPGQLRWVHAEIARILRQHPDLARVALKVPEFRSAEDTSSRIGNYLDAVVQLAAANAGVPIVTRLYSQMATRRADVKRHAEERVGRSETNWNEQMADAIAVAWYVAR